MLVIFLTISDVNNVVFDPELFLQGIYATSQCVLVRGVV